MLPKADPYNTPVHRRIDLILFAVVFAIVAILLSTAAHAGTAKDFFKNADLTTSGNYNPSGLPTNTTDVRLTSSTTALTIGGPFTLTLESLSVSNGSSYTISNNANGNGKTSNINLGNSTGFTNIFSGTLNDLVYLTGNSNLTIQGVGSGGNALNLVLQSSGNFNVGANSTLNISSAISGAVDLTKTGAGTLTLSGNNTFGAGKTFTLSAGTLNINSATALGAATNTFQIEGGTTINNTSGAAITVSNNNPIRINGDFTFTGSNALNLGTGNVSLGTATGTNRQITVSGSTLTIGGSISNGTTANSITKAGSGTLVLSGTSSYTGTTTVNSGTLLVNGGVKGSSSGTGTSTVNVNGGTLGGTGNISGAVNVATGATINPGATGGSSVGTLNVGALTLSGGTSAFNFASTTSFDQLGVAGDANLTSGLLSVMIQSGLNFTQGTIYTLIDATTLTGQFAAYADNTQYSFDGYDFIVRYDTAGGNFNLEAVPEPSTWAAAALSLAFVGFTQRRRFQKLARVRG